MIEVEMVDDIRKTEPKAVGSLTTRQVICIILAGTYSIPIAVHIPFDITLKIVTGILLALPVVTCGWIKLNNEPFEIVMIRYIYKHFLTPRKRKIKQENVYKETLKKIRRKEESDRIKKLSPAKRKDYLKKKKSGNTVVYSKKKSYTIYR